MPYGAPFDRYYENIYAPAVAAAGLESVRADSLFRSIPIIGDIWSLTQQASVILADLTDKNPNVFYELGLAHAIGKPAVLVSNRIEDVPFDLRSLRVLLYDKDHEAWGADLSERVETALRETLGDLAGSVPLPFVGKKKKPQESAAEDPVWYELRSLRQELNAIKGERYQDFAYSYPPRLDLADDEFLAPPKLVAILRREINKGVIDAPWATDRVLASILGYLSAGKKINAIKVALQASPLDLKGAKEFVERLEPYLRGKP